MVKQYRHQIKHTIATTLLFLGKISDEEMFTTLAGESYARFYTYLENLQKTDPERKVRYSDTVFLKPSSSLELFENIRHRLVYQVM